jgi:hypothetical protein
VGFIPIIGAPAWSFSDNRKQKTDTTKNPKDTKKEAHIVNAHFEHGGAAIAEKIDE